MYQGLAIWSPVIVAGLKSARNYLQLSTYPLDTHYKRIENIKVRIKSSQAGIQGKSVECQFYMELLWLLEDYQGNIYPLGREERLKEKIALSEFEPIPEQPLELQYIPNVVDFVWDADLKESSLHISYNMTYNLLAVREQIVQIQPAADTGYDNAVSISTPTDDQLGQISIENDKLRKQMYLYERDLNSLKRGLQKAELNNTSLNKEIDSYKHMVEELKEAVKRKEKILCSYENGIPDVSVSPATTLPEISLGKRIKRMFLNNQ